jgi:hypothetical protein
MIQAIKEKIAADSYYSCCSYNLVKFRELWLNLDKPDKSTGLSGVIPITVQKAESNVVGFYYIIFSFYC